MGVKLRPYGYPPALLSFRCPGCGHAHTIRTENAKGPGPTWSWNGSVTLPTFQPSVRVSGTPHCHFFVTNGRIRYEPDSTHALKGQTVDLPDWETTVENEPTNETKPELQPPATTAATPPAESQTAAPGAPATVTIAGIPPASAQPTPTPAPAAPGPHADLIAEAIEWVKSRGYEALAAAGIVAEHGFRKILADKANELGKPAPGAPSTTHQPGAGDVGDTGKHGELGSNALGYKPAPAAEEKSKSA